MPNHEQNVCEFKSYSTNKRTQPLLELTFQVLNWFKVLASRLQAEFQGEAALPPLLSLRASQNPQNRSWQMSFTSHGHALHRYAVTDLRSQWPWLHN